jgi:hypothetical protein
MPKPTSYHVKCRITSPHQAKSRFSGEMPWRPFFNLPRMENRRASRAPEQDGWHAFSGKTAPTQHTGSRRRPQAPHGTRRKRKKFASAMQGCDSNFVSYVGKKETTFKKMLEEAWKLAQLLYKKHGAHRSPNAAQPSTPCGDNAFRPPLSALLHAPTTGEDCGSAAGGTPEVCAALRSTGVCVHVVQCREM